MADLEGATEPGPVNSWAANAGEFAARWNGLAPEQRDEKVRVIQENSRLAVDFHENPHRDILAAIDAVKARRARTTWSSDARLLGLVIADLTKLMNPEEGQK